MTTKTESVRALIKKKPKLAPKALQAALKEQGVTASLALVSKVKYTKRKRGRKAGRKTADPKSVNIEHLMTLKRLVKDMGEQPLLLALALLKKLE